MRVGIQHLLRSSKMISQAMPTRLLLVIQEAILIRG